MLVYDICTDFKDSMAIFYLKKLLNIYYTFSEDFKYYQTFELAYSFFYHF